MQKKTGRLGAHRRYVCEKWREEGEDDEKGLTVADGAQRVIVVQALTHDTPLGKDGIGADAIFIKAASGTHQIISADVALVSSDGKIPVRKSKSWVSQHVLNK